MPLEKGDRGQTNFKKKCPGCDSFMSVDFHDEEIPPYVNDQSETFQLFARFAAKRCLIKKVFKTTLHNSSFWVKPQGCDEFLLKKFSEDGDWLEHDQKTSKHFLISDVEFNVVH